MHKKTGTNFKSAPAYLEDIYLNKVSIIMTPEKVPDVFFSLTDGRITEINYHYLDKAVRTIITSKI